MEDLVKKFQGLSQEWNKKNHNLAACQEKLEKLTVCYLIVTLFTLIA